MIARAIQEKTGTPATGRAPAGKTARCYSKMQPGSRLFHNQKEYQNSIPERTFHFFHRVFHRFCEKEAQFPTRFSTFSTRFSTRKPRSAYTRRNAARRFVPVSGKKSGHFAFYKKESRSFFFSFYSSHPQPFFVLSRLEKSSPEFSTSRKGSFFVWKKRGKLQFSTACRRTLQGHRQCVRTRSKSTCILCFCRGCATSKKQPGKVKTLFRAA